MPFAGKPILGIVGGIASGKSFVASLFKSLGCLVIDSDAIAHQVYRDPDVTRTLLDWYGPAILREDGTVDRRAIGSRVFRDADQRARLEALLHPRIDARRESLMNASATDPATRAFVWDSPLLIEAGLRTACDALIFVDTPHATRLERVRRSRGWDADELDRRERSQLPLAEKKMLATDIVDGEQRPESLLKRLELILNRLNA